LVLLAGSKVGWLLVGSKKAASPSHPNRGWAFRSWVAEVILHHSAVGVSEFFHRHWAAFVLPTIGLCL